MYFPNITETYQNSGHQTNLPPKSISQISKNKRSKEESSHVDAAHQSNLSTKSLYQREFPNILIIFKKHFILLKKRSSKA